MLLCGGATAGEGPRSDAEAATNSVGLCSKWNEQRIGAMSNEKATAAAICAYRLGVAHGIIMGVGADPMGYYSRAATNDYAALDLNWLSSYLQVQREVGRARRCRRDDRRLGWCVLHVSPTVAADDRVNLYQLHSAGISSSRPRAAAVRALSRSVFRTRLTGSATMNSSAPKIHQGRTSRPCDTRCSPAAHR